MEGAKKKKTERKIKRNREKGGKLEGKRRERGREERELSGWWAWWREREKWKERMSGYHVR